MAFYGGPNKEDCGCPKIFWKLFALHRERLRSPIRTRVGVEFPNATTEQLVLDTAMYDVVLLVTHRALAKRYRILSAER